MKSPATITSDVSEHLRVASVTCKEFIAANIMVWHGESSIQLVMEGFVRVFKLCKMTRARLKVSIDTSQNAHLSFSHKGIVWVSILRAEKIEEFYRLTADEQSKRIGNSLKGLPAPRVPLKRLSVKPQPVVAKQLSLTYSGDDDA